MRRRRKAEGLKSRSPGCRIAINNLDSLVAETKEGNQVFFLPGYFDDFKSLVEIKHETILHNYFFVRFSNCFIMF